MQNYSKTGNDWLTRPLYTKDDLLNQLDSGREWVDYLTANGWELMSVQPNMNTRALGNYERVCLTKTKTAQVFGEVKYSLSFQSSEQDGCEFICFQMVEGQSWVKNQIKADGFEQDITRFAFLCDGMGWVPIKEANANCRLATGYDLLKYLINKSEQRNGKETETHIVQNSLVDAALQMAEA